MKRFAAVLPAPLFLLFLEAVTWCDTRLRFLFASPSLVWGVAVKELPAFGIWHDTAVTGLEALLGLLAGTFLGTTAGLLLWGNGKLERFTRPYLVALGSVPVFAIAPMLIIWFGIGLVSKVVMAGFAVFFVALLQAHEGARDAASRHLRFARSLGAGNRAILRHLVLPGSLQWVFAGMKTNVGLALLGAFIGEFVSSEAGLGHYILKAGALYDMPRVIFGLMLLSALALSFNGAAGILERRFLMHAAGS